MEQRVKGTLEIWANSFTLLRVPKVFHLRRDPYERARRRAAGPRFWLTPHPCFELYPCGSRTSLAVTEFSPIGLRSFSPALRDFSTISALSRAKSPLGERRKSVTSSDEPDGFFLSATPSLNTLPGFSNPPLLRGPFSELSSTPCRKYCTTLKHYCWNVTCDTPSFPCSTANALRLPRTLLIESRCQISFPRSNSFGSQFRATIFGASSFALRLNLIASGIDW